MIYVSTACRKAETIKDVLFEFGENGIQDIELSGGTQYYESIVDDLVNLKEKYHLNFVFHAYFPPPKQDFVVNLASCNDKIYLQSIQHYKNTLELMEVLDCKVLSIHAGFIAEISPSEIGKEFNTKVIYSRTEAINRFTKAYKEIEELAGKVGITLYLENNVLSYTNYCKWNAQNYMLMTDYESIMEMKKLMNFNLLLDMAHLYVSCNTLGLDFGRQCELLHQEIKWVHLSDNNGVLDEHKWLKEQSIIFRNFINLDYTGDLTLETHGTMEQILTSKNLLLKEWGTR